MELPKVMSSRNAIRHVLGFNPAEAEGSVTHRDPLCLRKCQIVEGGPTYHSRSHCERGKLLALNVPEVVIEKTVPMGEVIKAALSTSWVQGYCGLLNFRSIGLCCVGKSLRLIPFVQEHRIMRFVIFFVDYS